MKDLFVCSCQLTSISNEKIDVIVRGKLQLPEQIVWGTEAFNYFRFRPIIFVIGLKILPFICHELMLACVRKLQV